VKEVIEVQLCDVPFPLLLLVVEVPLYSYFDCGALFPFTDLTNIFSFYHLLTVI
jgi:hypothetical protein